MKWETTEAMLESAKVFAEAQEDLAVKSDRIDGWPSTIYTEKGYQFYKDTADLLRLMSEKIKHLEEWAYKG
jgi:hypothetical protein